MQLQKNKEYRQDLTTKLNRMPFEIFVIPGIIFGLIGFYMGLKEKNKQIHDNE